MFVLFLIWMLQDIMYMAIFDCQYNSLKSYATFIFKMVVLLFVPIEDHILNLP